MFKKNYFYSIEWYDNNNEKRTSSGILSNIKRIKTSVDLTYAILDVIVDLEYEILKETEREFEITKYKILNFNLV